ncbi:MAG: glycerol-3-phosphate 1-O-acyltransferase PlsY [Proteobacteria bacterium]|nr:glycerol-3-phosphate 1-O-acyltransferase PlsY [Pseudomonadota bacterium]MBU1737068.1 glycerol-3-phosphate 1-O-acyltransferase PlsY [Pseudomonadota bacterium]
MSYALIIFSYLVGSIPFGLLYGKMAGVDVRKDGSRNIGATNVNRLLGRKLGALTLISDALKGLLPMLVVAHFPGELPHREMVAMLSGTAALVGHCFPVYLKFQGGKGVATALGIYLYLAPLPTLGAMALFVITVRLSGYVSMGSLAASLVMPVLLLLSGEGKPLVITAGLIAAIIWFKHHENIRRLVKGEEKSWKTKNSDAEKR